MIEGKRQLKNAFIYLAPPLIGNLFTLFSLAILTRYLSPEDFGVWALAQAYAFFVTGIANFGLNIGYERNFFETKEPNRIAELLYSTLFFVCGTLVVYGFITYFFASIIADFIIGSSTHANILFWAYCVAGIASLKAFYLTYLKNHEDAKSFARYTIDESILGTLLSLVMVVYLGIGIIGLVWGQLLAGLLVLIVLSLRTARSLPIRYNRQVLMDCFKISFPLTPRILFGLIGNHFDKYLLRLLDNVSGAGVYAIGQRISNVVFVFMTAIQNVYSPQVYKKMFELGAEGGIAVGRYLTPFFYFSIAVCLLMALFAEEMITILLPSVYDDSVEVIMIMCMLYGSYFFGKQPQLIFAKKTWITSFLTLFGVALNVAINIPFIYMWGVVGAAWGTMLAGVVTAAVTFCVSQHYYSIKWEYDKILPMLIIFFCSITILVLMMNGNVSYYLRLAVKIAVVGYFVYIGFLSKIIGKRTREMLMEALRHKIA